MRENMDEVRIDFQRGNGLIPAIVQDWKTGEVLMVAYMNGESWAKTRETGKACFWSRSRKKLWLKGETSGKCPNGQGSLISTAITMPSS